jgi:hypothetical protein
VPLALLTRRLHPAYVAGCLFPNTQTGAPNTANTVTPIRLQELLSPYSQAAASIMYCVPGIGR